MVTKTNPVFDPAQARGFIGKTLSTFDIDFNVDASASTGALGALNAAFRVVADRATIALQSPLTGIGQLISVVLEGEYGTAAYDGVNTETFALFLQREIRALGTVDTIVFGAATVTAGIVYKADQV